MPFFWRKKYFQTYMSKNYTKNKPSLRGFIFPLLIRRMSKTHRYTKKRVSSFISHKRLNAGMTLEAAMVLPVFLFAILSLFSSIHILKIKSCMDLAVVKAGNEISLEYYGGYVTDITMPFYAKQKISKFLKENLPEKDREKLENGIWVTDVSFREEENVVTFRVDYKVRPDFGLPGLFPVKLHTIYYGYGWLGYETGKEPKEMVFMSNTASVYHTDRNCSHLNVTIHEVNYENISQYRNKNGNKYQSCSFCDDIESDSVVYITPEGNNYHSIKNCIGLTRHIYTVPLSTVSYKNICTRCGE